MKVAGGGGGGDWLRYTLLSFLRTSESVSRNNRIDRVGPHVSLACC